MCVANRLEPLHILGFRDLTKGQDYAMAML